MRFRNLKHVRRGNPKGKGEIRVVKYIVPERERIRINRSQRRFSLRNILRLKILAPILLILIVLGSVGYFYINREKFVIREMNISPTRFIQTSEVSTLLENNLGQNFFIIFPSQIEKRLYQFFDLIESVKVEKVLPDKLNISIVEKDIKYLVVTENHNIIWDSKYNQIRTALNKAKLTLSEISYKLLSGRLNLEEVPMTEEQTLEKNKILLLTDEKERNKKLETFEKNLITYRISELKKLHKTAYAEAKEIYLNIAGVNNNYKLEQLNFLDEVDEDKMRENIQNYEVLSRNIKIDPELILFNEFGRIIILYNEKIIKIEDTENMEKEVKVLNTLLDTLETNKTDYFQITITGEKVVVL